MEFNWQVNNYDYRNRSGNLTSEAQGKVKSKKYFPTFSVDGKEIVFKPLSKTKPFTTPYFAYSEVFWSTILNKYFDSSTPIYQLGIIKHIEDEYPEKYHHGTTVDRLAKDDYKLLNLYELCRKYQDLLPDISNYTNYCEVIYDYTAILTSQFFKEHPELGQEVAMQILCSILRQDQNFHYENVLFFEQGDSIEIAPMIDHEFSTMFMYLDRPKVNDARFFDTQVSLIGVPDDLKQKIRAFYIPLLEKEKRNIDIITELYPETAREFLEQLKAFITDFSSTPLHLEDNGYLVPFNSYDFQIGHARYKEHDEKKAEDLERDLEQVLITPDMVEEKISNQVLQNAQTLSTTLEKRLVLK